MTRCVRPRCDPSNAIPTSVSVSADGNDVNSELTDFGASLLPHLTLFNSLMEPQSDDCEPGFSDIEPQFEQSATIENDLLLNNDRRY